ncbi:dihydropteroate synthase [Rhodospirillum sp. A1_3_36]|uniref:dihydropteroate synthase n=1 Tax=Rhodospirillum sp. A1_3_36 TaxID=3391666 RepID=UPI0039A40ED9
MTSTARRIGSPAPPRGFFLGGRRTPEGCLYLAPAGLVRGPVAGRLLEEGRAWPLAGRTDMAFTLLSLFLRDGSDRILHGVQDPETLRLWSQGEGEAVDAHVGRLFQTLTRPRAPFAGLERPDSKPLVMGILNVTPDSFSDGGVHWGPQSGHHVALTSGLAMLEAGATILDVGGESTRPGADPVPPDEEIARVVPVIRELANRGAVVSIDTYHAATMGAALDAGALIVNDITGLTGDPEALPLVARRRAPVVVMHIQGEPRTMQSDPTYADAPLDVMDWLSERLRTCREAGLSNDLLCVDPGIGFGKTVAHNLQILEATAQFLGLGAEVLVGASRKSLIGKLCGVGVPRERLPGSLAIATAAAARGAAILRVHDVPETVQALTVAEALERA